MVGVVPDRSRLMHVIYPKASPDYKECQAVFNGQFGRQGEMEFPAQNGIGHDLAVSSVV